MYDAGGHRVISPRAPRDAERVVVFVPGRWCTPRLWALDEPARDLRVALAEAGFASVTARFRCTPAGDGAQPAVAGVRTRELLADVASALTAAAETLGARSIVLCGYSMGASLAFLAAGRHPVAALVALDGGLPLARTRRQPAPGCVANPNRHPRFVRSALALIASPLSTTSADVLRWRLSQNLWWPAGQVEEIRCGVSTAGEPLADSLRDVRCPILCVATDERDSPDRPRSVLTAQRTNAPWTRAVRLSGWRHEDPMIRARDDDDGLLGEIVRFLENA